METLIEKETGKTITEEPKQQVKVSCCNCLYYLPLQEDKKMGSCQFNPPKVFPVNVPSNINGFRPTTKTQYTSIWPATDWDKFCSNFTPARSVTDQIEAAVDSKPKLVV